MGSTVIPATEGICIRIEDNGKGRWYYLCVPDYDSPEFDITPLLSSRDDENDD